MKKLIVVMGLLSLTTSSLAASVHCFNQSGNTTVCGFDRLNHGSEAHFYCVADSNVTHVSMRNEKVLITGFNHDGHATFGKGAQYPMSAINSVYFSAKADPSHWFHNFGGVLIQSEDGHIACFAGNGGRSHTLPGYGFA